MCMGIPPGLELSLDPSPREGVCPLAFQEAVLS